MLTLPVVSKQSIGMQPIDWTGLPRRFINPDELECLIALLRAVNPHTVVEFGVNEGRTAKALMNNLPSIKCYVGVDVPFGYVTAKEVQRKEVPQRAGHMVLSDPRFSVLLPARGSASLMPDDLPWADAVFIDGDHSYRGVMHDTMLAKAILNPGGIIVWHDYHDLGTVDVREALHDLAASGEALRKIEGTWLAFQKYNDDFAIDADDRQLALAI